MSTLTANPSALDASILRQVGERLRSSLADDRDYLSQTLPLPTSNQVSSNATNWRRPSTTAALPPVSQDGLRRWGGRKSLPKNHIVLGQPVTLHDNHPIWMKLTTRKELFEKYTTPGEQGIPEFRRGHSEYYIPPSRRRTGPVPSHALKRNHSFAVTGRSLVRMSQYSSLQNTRPASYGLPTIPGSPEPEPTISSTRLPSIVPRAPTQSIATSPMAPPSQVSVGTTTTSASSKVFRRNLVPDECRAMLTEIFDYIDTRGVGRLTLDDVARFNRVLGGSDNAALEDARQAMLSADRNGDSEIDKEEWFATWESTARLYGLHSIHHLVKSYLRRCCFKGVSKASIQLLKIVRRSRKPYKPEQ